MMMNSERRVLVTGAGGYIGPVVTEHLLGLGYKVRALDVFLYPTRSVLEPYSGNGKFDFVSGDHGDGPLIRDALDGVTDVVILSGLVGDPITRKYPDASKKINEDGMQVTVLADATKPQDGEQLLFTAVEVQLFDSLHLRTGYKYNYQGVLGARGFEDKKVDEVDGMSYDVVRTEEGLTAGLGLNFGMMGYDATVDYAFTSFGILDSVHQFSLQFQF